MNKLSTGKIVRLTAVFIMLWGLLSSKSASSAASKLTLWHSWTGHQAALLDSWITEYHKNNSLVTIEATYIPFFELVPKLQATTDHPDIIIAPSDWGGTISGLVMPLDSHLSAELRGQVVDPAWKTTTYNGKIIGIPLDLQGLALYYHKTLVDEKKIPQTLDDLLAQSKALTQADTNGLVMSKDFYTTSGIFFAVGGTLIDQHGNDLLTSGTAFKKYLTLLKDLWQRSHDKALQLDVRTEGFKVGKIAFLIDGSWNLFDYQQVLGANLGVTVLPTVQGQPWTPFLRTDTLYVSASSKQLDVALDFAQYATNPNGQKLAVTLAGMVPVNTAAQSGAPLVAQFARQLLIGVPVPNRAEMSLYWTSLHQAIEAVTVGGQDVNQVADDTAMAIKQAIDLFHNPNLAKTPTATPTLPG